MFRYIRNPFVAPAPASTIQDDRSIFTEAAFIYSSPVPRPRIERDEPIEPLTTKLPRSLIKRVRVRIAEDDDTVQDFMVGAITREIARRERLEARRNTPRQ